MSFGARGGFGGAIGGRGGGFAGGRFGRGGFDSDDCDNFSGNAPTGGRGGGFAGFLRSRGGFGTDNRDNFGVYAPTGGRGSGFACGPPSSEGFSTDKRDNFGSGASVRGRGVGFARSPPSRSAFSTDSRDNLSGGVPTGGRGGGFIGGQSSHGRFGGDFLNAGDESRDKFGVACDNFGGGAAGGRGVGQGGRGGFGGDRSNAKAGEDFGCGGSRSEFARPSGGDDAFLSPPQGFDSGAAAGSCGFPCSGSDYGPDEFRGDARPQNNYIPEVRPVEDIYREDTANAENYRQVTDDDDEIHVSGPKIDINVRLNTWEDAGFSGIMLKNIIERSMYIRPRKIQAQVIPFVMAGRDVKGHAETGSGKTAAFMLPIIHKLMNPPNTSSEFLGTASPYAIVIEPTRELCNQVYEQGRKFAYETGVSVAKCYGQYNMRENLNEIRAGCNILCATTGRLKHFIMSNLISTRNLMFFVLDEADTLLESNFLEDIREIVNSPNFPNRNSRQTMLFSATFPELVQQLSSDVLRDDCVFISNQKMVAANSRVVQCFESVTAYEKKDRLLQLLYAEVQHRTSQNPDAPPLCRTLVFVRKKHDADLLALYLTQKNIKATTINGDRPQRLRELALSDFRNNLVHVLVSTDVCARGIDIKDLDHVINFDLPNDAVTYVHRIGRTGRLKHGRATSFFDETDPNDLKLAKNLVKCVRDVSQEAPEYLLRAAGMSSDSGFAASANNQASSGW